MLDRLRSMIDAKVGYSLGAKLPNQHAVPGRDFKAVDCSGCVDNLVYFGSGGTVDLPEGSWYEQEAVEAAGLKQTRNEYGILKDGAVRIAFLPASRANNDRHVVLIYMGMTLESSGGVGPNRRPWTPNASNWMGRCDVYVLCPPPAQMKGG